MAKLRGTGADVFKVLEAWISAFFLLTMVTNVLCSGKFQIYILVKNQRHARCLSIRARRGDCIEDFRHRKSSSKLDNRLANRTRLRWEQHAVRFERHRGAYNVLE
jgi:hypothetical protein